MKKKQTKLIDLHTHTTASDGSCTPSEVVALAVKQGLAAIAITDHDTIDGYGEAAAAAVPQNLEVVPGLEISTKFHSAVHILGYYVNPLSEELCRDLEWIVMERDERNEKICALMRADGLPVEYSTMKKQYGGVIGRPHFARLLVEFGMAEDVQDGFRRYMDKGRKYFQPRTFLSIERSIEVIAAAGGIPVLAHPFQYRLDDEGLRDLIEHCMDHGLRGMECLYSGYTAEQIGYLETLAAEYRLLETGGSDFHGTVKPHIQLGAGTGDLAVPYSLLETIKDQYFIR